MIVRLLPSQIPDYWEFIKYAAVTVNRLTGEKDITTYCRNLLKNIMAEKYQVWLIYSEDKIIKTVAITSIFLDIGDIPHLLLDVGYGYNPSSEYDKIELVEAMAKFAKTIGCNSIIAYTKEPLAINALKKMGLEETFKIFSRSV